MNKMKNYLKMWLIPLLLVIIVVAGCEDRIGITTPPTITIPTVSSTSPANAATGVAFNSQITATFSEAMNSSTITTATFTLMQGTSFVSGTVSYDGTTATFAPSSPLAPNTTYTSTITTGAKDSESSSLANNYVWSFTTGASAIVVPPVVSFTDPANAATGVALNQKIAATFSVAMDATTITASTFTLRQGTTPVSGLVSYSGITAIFAPSNPLTSNTAYTVTITTGAKDLAGIALANNYVWSFTTGAAIIVTPPTVSLTDPLNLATGVALNQKISATFSKTMDATTIQTSTFTLKQGSTSVSGFVFYSGTTAIFSPLSNLAASTVYTATITTGAKDLAGNALANNYVWSFTTGAGTVVTPPTVILTDPLNVATGVPLNQKVAATFSKTMDATTISTSTFTLMQGITPVTGFVSYSGTTAIFAPTSILAPNTIYTATITTGAKDLAGNALANNYVWSFTTGAAVIVTPPIVISTDPLDAATGVALTKQISANFSKTMDATTISTSTFTLTQGTTPVSGFVSYSGTSAIFAPTSNLIPNTIYTATITTGAKDLAGNALENNYVWSFTTGAAVIIIPPTVILTDPLNLAIGVPLNKQIKAIFSTIMDASTITTATFTLMQGTSFVSGTVSYLGTIATFIPSGPLTQNTKYTATITTGAKNLAGVSMTNNYVWSFTTSISSYTVTLSADPSDGGTVSGDGSYNSGSSVTVTATANPGYSFSNWTENGLAVSINTNYTFTITGDRTLVANFSAETPPPTNHLGSAGSYGIMATSAITSTGLSVINGDVSLEPGTSMTGFPPGVVNGTIHINDASSAQARADLLVGYNYYKGLPPGTTIGAGADLGALYPLGIPPGTYTSGSTMLVSTPLVLDAGGNADAIWVFQIGSSLTTGASISLLNGAQAKNVFWVPTLDATVGVGTIFYGTIITGRDATAVTGSTIYGRILAGATIAGTIALQTATVNVPLP